MRKEQMEPSCQSSYPLVGQRNKTVPSAQPGHTNNSADNAQQSQSSHLTCEKVNSDTQVCSQQLLLAFMLCKSLPFVSGMSAGSNNRNLFLPSFKQPRSSTAGRGLLAYCHKSLCYCHCDHWDVQNTKSNSPYRFLLQFSQVTLSRRLDQS